MTIMRNCLLSACLFTAAIMPALANTVTIGTWTPAFFGIDQTTAKIDGKDASSAYVLRIDLAAPGIRFYSTPHQGTSQTIASTDSQFLTKYGLQVALNANFFAPCCNAAAEAKTMNGLAVSDGNVVGLPVSTPGQNDALVISRHNQAAIIAVSEQTDLTDIYTAVTGSAIVVQNGQNIGVENNAGDGQDPNPRTLVGLSQDGHYMFLVAIDGRQPGYSVGTTHTESAEILLALGAWNALNLDGGGSTSLVIDNGQGGAKVLNRPSGGAERYDANQIGIRALPIPATFSIPVILDELYTALNN